MTELRIFGPPGTGKTTYMASQISKACETYGVDRVMVASFTRAAAAEIGSRGLPIPRHMLGTLHAHAYRTLQQPELAEKHLKDWNEFAQDRHAISVGGVDLDDVIEGNISTSGDEIMQRYHVYRAMLRPRMLWEADVRFFAEKWEAWKSENELVDFTDMIEQAMSLEHPGKPAIGFFDEAQDFTPLELAYVRCLGQDMKYVVLAGDDDQNLYAFKGATPDAFLDPPIPDRQKRVLAQSYRIPSSVHHLAARWVEKLSRRESKEYAPRDYEGQTRIFTAASEYGVRAPNYDSPDKLMDDAQQYIEQGKSVMFLGSCAYMLDPLKQYLKSEAMPFHNPYRRKRGDWNPLFAGRGTSVAQRLAAFVRYQETDWSPNDIKLFTEHLSKPKVFAKGGAEKLKIMPQAHLPIPGTTNLLTIFREDFIHGVFAYGLQFFLSCLLDSHKHKYVFSTEVLQKHGAQALTDDPKIVLGTIHSVKGGEADVVYLMPDLSRAGFASFLGSPDETIRLMYVGMTRTREILCLTGAASQYAVRQMG